MLKHVKQLSLTALLVVAANASFAELVKYNAAPGGGGLTVFSL